MLRMYKTSEVAEVLNMSTDTIKTWIGDGRIDAIKLNRSLRICGCVVDHLRTRGIGAAQTITCSCNPRRERIAALEDEARFLRRSR